MRQLYVNKIIIPTIKEILHDLHGFIVFSNLDSQFLDIRKSPSLVSVPISNHG